MSPVPERAQAPELACRLADQSGRTIIGTLLHSVLAVGLIAASVSAGKATGLTVVGVLMAAWAIWGWWQIRTWVQLRRQLSTVSAQYGLTYEQLSAAIIASLAALPEQAAAEHPSAETDEQLAQLLARELDLPADRSRELLQQVLAISPDLNIPSS